MNSWKIVSDTNTIKEIKDMNSRARRKANDRGKKEEEEISKKTTQQKLL